MKKTYDIETSPMMHERIERFFAMLHHNSRSGHSGLFAMPLDGDGPEKVSISPVPRFNYEAELIGGVGYHVEIAYDKSYGGWFADTKKASPWHTGPAANLYKDSEIVSTVPSKDWSRNET